MNYYEACDLVAAEVVKAMDKFPEWPDDPHHALSIVAEEKGELSQAILKLSYENDASFEDVKIEAIQMAAMAMRFLMSIERYEYSRSSQHRQEQLIPAHPLVERVEALETALSNMRRDPKFLADENWTNKVEDHLSGLNEQVGVAHTEIGKMRTSVEEEAVGLWLQVKSMRDHIEAISDDLREHLEAHQALPEEPLRESSQEAKTVTAILANYFTLTGTINPKTGQVESPLGVNQSIDSWRAEVIQCVGDQLLLDE